MADETKDPNTCPNCGCTNWATEHRPDVDPTSLRATAIQKSRDKLTQARGELQRCQCCGYQRRAKDQLVPATA